MPLHTELRVKSLESIIGNEQVVSTLQDQIARDNRAKVYLFSGTPGTGKTTMARILADALSLNVDERNVANDNGVDFARSFVSDVLHLGFKGPTLFILDEVHRLTAAAQEIILKDLEEPPKGAYIALCTSEVDKLKASVLRRCVKCNLRPPNKRQLNKYIQEVVTKYELSTSVDAIREITNIPEINVGTALMYLEEIRGVPEEKQAATIKNYYAGDADVKELCQACLRSNWAKVANLIDNINTNPETMRREIMGYMTRVLLNGTPEAFPFLKALENVRIENGKYAIVRALYEAVLLRDRGGYK